MKEAKYSIKCCHEAVDYINTVRLIEIARECEILSKFLEDLSTKICKNIVVTEKKKRKVMKKVLRGYLMERLMESK